MAMQQIKISPKAKGKNLLAWLRDQGYPISADCGGIGKCNKCKVRLLSGEFFIANKPITSEAIVKACQTTIGEKGGEIELLHPNQSETPQGYTPSTEAIHKASSVGVALDIGTTTLEATLINLKDGTILSSASCLNPQAAYGADVLSRISAAENGNLDKLCVVIRNGSKGLIEELISKARLNCQPEKIIVVGNPTMTHILCNISPSTIGRHPFTPAFTDERHETGAWLGYDKATIILPALASAFIGSDITSGIAHLQLLQSKSPALMVDLGTNGEIVLWTGEKLLTCTAAAGPALEGATMTCGTGGVNGAIKAIQYSPDGEITYQTIGDAKPIGICGSGLVDIIAHLVKTKKVDETGLLQDSEEYKVIDNIYITQKDIREFQLAKGAICAAITLILNEANLQIEDLEHIHIAGGLGSTISVKSAITVGLIPKGTEAITTHKGNTALKGAQAALTNPNILDAISRAAKECQNINLNDIPPFTSELMKQMYFHI